MTHFAQGWDPDWAWVAAVRSISTVRDELYWEAIEPEKGVYRFPRQFDAYMDTLRVAGLSPLIVLSFENSNYDGGNTPCTDEAIAAYGRYGIEVLRHYGAQINALEIWNEYNGSFCRGPATGDRANTYARMLAATYARLKAERPDLTILGGSTINVPLPYWEKLLRAGALDSMDALSVHPYRYNTAPEGIEDDISALQNLVRKYNQGRSKPIWVSEVGWSIQEHPAAGEMFIDEATQAKFLVRSYALLLSAGVERVYWYLLRDHQDFTLGLMKPDATPRLAAYAMQTMVGRLSGAQFVRRESTVPGLYSLLFARADGSSVRVLWSLQPVTLELSGHTGVTGLTGDALGAPAALALTDSPVFVEGPMAGLPAVPDNCETALTDASHGFSSTQGANGWSFGSFVGASTSFQAMPTYSVTDWTQVWSSPYSYNTVTPGDQHPSTTEGLPVSAVRRWESTAEGVVHLTGRFQCGTGGDGVGVRILVDGQPLFRQLIGGGRAILHDFDFQQAVHPGTKIDFAVDPGPGTDINFDATAVSVTLATVRP